MTVLLAVDGGNSKTDVALVRADGTPLAVVRGPQSSPHRIGLQGTMELLDQLVARAAQQAGVEGDGPVAEVGTLVLAGADLPAEETALNAAAAQRGWAGRVVVRNDTYALLRMGTSAGWGVAVVCGAGMNCIGVGPDGAQVRYPALGRISGDWGGGDDLALEALWAACRAHDGRGPATVLEERVPAHFGLAAPYDVAVAVHQGTLPRVRLLELTPVLLAAADEDAVAAEVVDRLAAEVAGIARVTIERLGRPDAEVVLGGGVLRSRHPRLLAGISDGLPGASVVVADEAPVVGAALMALDMVGGADGAEERLRRELDDQVRSNGHG